MEDSTNIPVLAAEERDALETRWYEGRMLHFVTWVVAFAEQHRHELLQSAPTHDGEALVRAVKKLIVETGSIHLAGELRDQRQEIANEVWYGGQRGEHDCAAIQMEWTSRHAAAWRRWRVLEYLFVVDRCVTEIVDAVRAGYDQRPHDIAPLASEENISVRAA